MKGGEEKVEEVRLGLLGFKREIDGMRGKVTERRKEVGELFSEKKDIAKEMRIGRGLLEVNSKLEELEESLNIGTKLNRGTESDPDPDFTDSENGSDDEEDVRITISLSRLRRRIQQYINIKKLIDKLGSTHPFLLRQEDRVLRVRQTLLLDLRSVLRQVRHNGSGNGNGVLKILGLYQDMGEAAEAPGALRDQKE